MFQKSRTFTTINWNLYCNSEKLFWQLYHFRLRAAVQPLDAARLLVSCQQPAAVQAADNAALILPNGVLSTEQNAEAEIRENLITSNLIDAVIINPDDMFECTSIGTCIYSLKKNKQTATVEMVDMRQTYTEEIRLQNGQFGGASHTNRTYQKTVKTYSQENINSMLGAIANRRNKESVWQSVG